MQQHTATFCSADAVAHGWQRHVKEIAAHGRFVWGKKHWRHMASALRVNLLSFFSSKLSQARALFSLRLRMRTLRHTDAYQGATLIQGTHRWYTIVAQMLWHTVPDGGADAMAHDPRWWRRWRDRKRRKRERAITAHGCNNTARCSGTRMQWYSQM